MSNFTHDVFISYSHSDADWVKTWLLPRLEAAGLRVCIDYRDFEVGVPSIVNMENAVKNSRKTILVMTPNWTGSEWTDFESLLTQTGDPVGRRRRLLPLLLKACDLPDRLAIFTYADFTDSTQWDTQVARVITASRESPTTQPFTQLTPNLVHPYPLQANFTGRVDERKELTAWLADDAKPICALVAMGGMGKSALSWYWVTRDVLPSTDLNLDGVMWWSFYEGESSFAKFVDEALKYVSGQPTIDAVLLPTTYDRAQELRKQLQTKRVLFVLDGFERQLRAYARLDAAYQQDDTANTSREERACVDPITARLLNDIAAGATRAKVLLTTRLPVSDLEDRAGDALAGILERDLNELPRDDAVAFMRDQGVKKGMDTEIANVCEEYGYHPLSLRLLSGLIARDAQTPGDIVAAPRHDVHADLIQRQHHVLEQSYNALPKRERALLSRISAFRGPMTYDALTIFNKPGEEAKLEVALNDLQARGLLQRDTLRNRYDLHPIVRHYAYERLTNKKGIHTRLRDYFATIPAPDEDKVQSIEDLAPIIELYYHTANAGLYDEAANLYYVRLSNPIQFRLGAYQTGIELLRALFPSGQEYSPRVKKEDAHAWALNELANLYGHTGQLRSSTSLYQRVNDIYENVMRNESLLAVGLGNIAYQQIFLGELRAADWSMRRRIEICHNIGDKRSEAIGHRELGRLMTYRGAFDEAAQELDTALGLFETVKNFPRFGVIWSYRALLALLKGDARAAIEAAHQARRLEDEIARTYYPVERDIIHAEWLLGATLIMGEKEANTVALTHLTEALKRCRHINLVEFEPDILLTWARWHHARGNKKEAHAHAEEALSIADRCEYRLAQAEIHNFLARLALDAGNRETARQHAKRARERAWCDGPPYCYKPALDEAEGVLKELGAGEE